MHHGQFQVRRRIVHRHARQLYQSGQKYATPAINQRGDRSPIGLFGPKLKIAFRSLVWAAQPKLAKASIMPGSIRSARVTSRLAPKPPKTEPASSAARTVNNRASAKR